MWSMPQRSESLSLCQSKRTKHSSGLALLRRDIRPSHLKSHKSLPNFPTRITALLSLRSEAFRSLLWVLSPSCSRPLKLPQPREHPFTNLLFLKPPQPDPKSTLKDHLLPPLRSSPPSRSENWNSIKKKSKNLEKSLKINGNCARSPSIINRSSYGVYTGSPLISSSLW